MEEPTMTDAKVKQTSKATVDEYMYLNLRDFAGASKASHIRQQAGLKWEDFLPEGENVQEFVRKKGVDFTTDGASAAADNGLNSVSSQGDWLQVYNRGLTNLLNDKADNNKIFDWIEHYVPDTHKKQSEFIRALVTIICQHAAEGKGQGCRIDPEILKQLGPVLQRYIDNKRPLELQALYAVQALNRSLHSPPGLLRILFDVLYDEDVITEEAFYDWKDPKESAGKGVVLKSVTNQWSPVNPEGKKRYDSDFLLQFQKGCTNKPDGLPNIPDIVLDKAVVQPLSLYVNQGRNQGGKSLDFMPHFMKSPQSTDQWSPVNPEGKKRYDRDFLLQFQKGCTNKPDGLPNIPDIVLDKGVDFTTDGASAADNGLNSVSSQGDWLQIFNRGLTNLLNEKPDNNKIFDWIEHNVEDTHKKQSEFIRALVTIICQHAAEGKGQGCRIDPEILKQRGPVLQRYINNKRPLELQALYAVQALNHSLHSPPGPLRISFDVLYDEDVITEDTFYDWKASKDPKESAGKGVALKSVTTFFTWLAEAD